MNKEFKEFVLYNFPDIIVGIIALVALTLIIIYWGNYSI